MQSGTIVVAANFTAEPLQDSLGFWMKTLEIPLEIAFAPYDQIFQQLLDPESQFSRNTSGINIVLLKLDNWSRLAGTDASRDGLNALERNTNELVDALSSAAQRSNVPHFLMLCPPAPELLRDAATAAGFANAENTLRNRLAGRPHLVVVPWAEVMTRYPVEAYYDPASNSLGQVPYTAPFFAALGTTLARRVRAQSAAPYKVLVLDCDNTLWGGLCGELGPRGVQLDDSLLAWQRFLVDQFEAGILLCLCSKNNAADVREVFKHRPEMPLGWQHIVGARINWEPKSANLKSLAAELKLGLESFIVVDDSAFEVGEIRAHCPDVLALQFPADSSGIRHFIDHCWAFDRTGVTAEDRHRTSSYRENALREAEFTQAASLEEFLGQLDLRISIAVPRLEDFPRVAQLIQRTNQFNLTTLRRSEAELRRLCETGVLECRSVRVQDRFGDYGLVGVMLFAMRDDSLCIDSFLLSCRALGRRVEHHMLAELGEIATSRDRKAVELRFVKTERNAPALTFLNSLGVTPETAADERRFRLSDTAARAAVSLARASHPVEAATPAPAATARSGTGSGKLLMRISAELCTPDRIQAAIAADQRRTRPALSDGLVAPRNDAERRIAELWKQALHLDAVGVRDDFFALGGTSLDAVQIFARLRRRFRVSLNPIALLQAPTIEQLAALISQPDPEPRAHAFPLTSLVPIQSQGSRVPLFCVHAGAGSVLFYYPLARALGSDQPLYALQAQGLYDRAVPHSSVEEMASHYLSEIRTIQPEGPYQLAGFCFGAMVAFEMAQQLRGAGHAVALLASFDGLAPSYYPAWGRSTRRAQPVAVPRSHPPRWAKAFPEALARRLVKHLDIVRALRPREKLPYVGQKLADYVSGRARRLRNRLFRAYLRDKHSPIPNLFRRITWYFTLNSMLVKERYRPVKYPGNLAVFSLQDRYPDPHLGWDRWIGGAVTAKHLAGDFRHHRVLMDEPMVSSLAKALEPLLLATTAAAISGDTQVSLEYLRRRVQSARDQFRIADSAKELPLEPDWAAGS